MRGERLDGLDGHRGEHRGEEPVNQRGENRDAPAVKAHKSPFSSREFRDGGLLVPPSFRRSMANRPGKRQYRGMAGSENEGRAGRQGSTSTYGETAAGLPESLELFSPSEKSGKKPRGALPVTHVLVPEGGQELVVLLEVGVGGPECDPERNGEQVRNGAGEEAQAHGKNAEGKRLRVAHVPVDPLGLKLKRIGGGRAPAANPAGADHVDNERRDAKEESKQGKGALLEKRPCQAKSRPARSHDDHAQAPDHEAQPPVSS